MKRNSRIPSFWIFALVGGLLFLGGCKPQEETLPAELDPVIWSAKIANPGLVMTPLAYGNTIITGSDSELGFTVTAYDMEDGSIVWDTTVNPPGSFDPVLPEQAFIIDDNLVLSDGRNIFVMDPANGSTKWWYRNEKFNSEAAVQGNYIYKSDYFHKSSSAMYRYSIVDGTEQKLFNIDKTTYGGGYSPDLRMPIIWQNPQGDEILICQNRTYGWFINEKPKMDVLAFNITADSMLWYVEGLDESSSYARPALDGDKVYFYGMFDAYCLDANTGQTIWNYRTHDDDLLGDFNTGNILIIGDMLIVKPDSYWMYAVDKNTGVEMWHNKNTAPMPALMTVNNDTLWFSSGGVLAIDTRSGQKLFDWDDNRGSWITPVAFHPTKNWIYTSNAKYLYCLNPKYMK